MEDRILARETREKTLKGQKNISVFSRVSRAKKQNLMNTQNKRLIGTVLTAAFLLLIPFVAMQFTDEMKWGLFDFVLAGVLLLGAGLAIEVALRLVKKFVYRIAVCLGILAALALVWIEIAVGLFGTPLAGS